MHLIDHFAENVSDVAIRSIQTALLEFLLHDAALHFHRLVRQQQILHPVGFHPKRRFHVFKRKDVIIVGDVAVCPCIVVTAGLHHHRIEFRDSRSASKHQMLAQMRKPSIFWRLVFSPDTIQQIDRNHSCRTVSAVHNLQPIAQPIARRLCHSITEAFRILTSSLGLSLRAVSTH